MYRGINRTSRRFVSHEEACLEPSGGFNYNRDEAFRNELDKIRGVQMRDESVTKHFPSKKVYIDEQGEFLKKVPPEGIFEIPSDYVRKDRIEWDDLR